MFFEEEFNAIHKEFDKVLKTKQKTVSDNDLNFAVLGAPLMKSRVLILSSNWAGPLGKPSDPNMPKNNELLEYPTESNNVKLINFFNRLFEDNVATENFLRKSIYANACFIRTPNTKDYFNILKFGYEISLPFLDRIIDFISPTIIICFGNEKGSVITPTNSIAVLMRQNNQWWDEGITERISRRSSCYYFLGKLNDSEISVYSFPHANNIRWNAEEWENLKSNNTIFLRLKKDLNMNEYY